jgi:type VI protein secretion system component VasF
VLVDSSHAQKATTVLADTLTENEADEEAELRDEARLRRGGPATETSPARLALWIGAALLAAIVIVWLLYALS